MSMFEDCRALANDFEGCSDEIVQRIKASVMNSLCDPKNHSCTSVKLPLPIHMSIDSILVRPIFYREFTRVVLTIIVDSNDNIHTFPYSSTDQDLVPE